MYWRMISNNPFQLFIFLTSKLSNVEIEKDRTETEEVLASVYVYIIMCF